MNPEEHDVSEMHATHELEFHQGRLITVKAILLL